MTTAATIITWAVFLGGGLVFGAIAAEEFIDSIVRRHRRRATKGE